ncbi:kunitz-type serine protease inhibitor homolog calcicludine-like [Ixodes scapularis]|uniref:kunitz-type serine protease inhibitor homolog calcicludine-like n=1 Tax=Ixodes scapularis TaxID=6945 RepID=UPI001A9DA749|nr:kunitz-type serine protease inhibitor homolog calcicludine-like [Ixodes scapularis]
MKATFAAICFLAAAVYTFAVLSEEVCRAYHAGPFNCGDNETMKHLYYFKNSTDKCEPYLGCGGNANDFGSRRSCRDSCPYGKNKSKSPRTKKTKKPTHQ